LQLASSDRPTRPPLSVKEQSSCAAVSHDVSCTFNDVSRTRPMTSLASPTTCLTVPAQVQRSYTSTRCGLDTPNDVLCSQSNEQSETSETRMRDHSLCATGTLEPEKTASLKHVERDYRRWPAVFQLDGHDGSCSGEQDATCRGLHRDAGGQPIPRFSGHRHAGSRNGSGARLSRLTSSDRDGNCWTARPTNGGGTTQRWLSTHQPLVLPVTSPPLRFGSILAGTQ
jgi:hypothetical protein